MVDVLQAQAQPRSTFDTERRTFKAMATTVELLLPAISSRRESVVGAVANVFADVQAACTRFDPTSPLMVANASPHEWHGVPTECLDAITAAHQAYLETGGLFDPRILTSLVAAGYDRSLPFRSGPVQVTKDPSRQPVNDRDGQHSPWEPRVDVDRSMVRIGPHPIDLGGIGKGYAVMRASASVGTSESSFLINAGGDCYARGHGPDDGEWLIGVEDPHGGDQPVAVLGVTDAACATSSTRLRRWTVDGQASHHLIDPRTGRPGGNGLAAVTVVAADTIRAEVWSKALFLSGTATIRALAEHHRLAALWVSADGQVSTSSPMAPYVRWQVPRAH